jgi:cell wall-associated NlpC family hydrolase
VTHRPQILTITLTTILAFAVLCGGILLLAALASADPIDEKKSEAEQIRQQIAAFDVELARAVEKYNQVNEDLERVRGQIKKNKKALKIAEIQLSVARGQLDERVVAIYKQRSVNLMDVFFTADSFDEIASQIELMRRVGEQDSALVDEVTAQRKKISQKRKALIKDRKARERFVAEAAEQKADIEGRIGERQSMLSGVEEEIRELERAEQERARRAAAASVAAARAAAEAEEQDQPTADTAGGSASSSGASNGSTGSSSSGGSGGSGSSGGSSDAGSSGGSSNSGGSSSSGGALGGSGRPYIVAIAARYLGTPYKYGGTSPQTGFDCSGFVQYVYRQAGITLPRTSMTQQQIGRRVSMNALLPGDLVFRGYPAYHVGIYVGNGQAIHSPHTGAVVSYQSISYWTSAVRP